MLRRSARRLIDQRCGLLDHIASQISLLDSLDKTPNDIPNSHAYRYWRCPPYAPLFNSYASTAAAITQHPFPHINTSPLLPTNPQQRLYSTSTTPPRSPPQQLPVWMQHLPPSLIPYLQLSRLDKPIGTWLLLWPCLWSIALAAPAGSLPDPYLSALFTAGAVLLRGAGCTVNDLWDRELDAKVERTKTRPLASGAVTPVQAVGWLGLQLTAGLGILMQLNPFAQVVGASSLALVVTYPLMKRITGWPQAFLGLTFNWGALFGWAAVHGSCDWSIVLPLYIGAASWTLVYDTIYAHQDKNDDVAVGIKSTALTFGADSKYYLSAFAVANTALLGLAGYTAGVGEFYYAGVAAGAGHLAWQIASVDLDNGGDCHKKFVSNRWYGALIVSGIVADKVLLLG